MIYQGTLGGIVEESSRPNRNPEQLITKISEFLDCVRSMASVGVFFGRAAPSRNPRGKASTDVGDLPTDLIRFRKWCFFVDASGGRPVHEPEAAKNEDSI